MEHFHKSVPGWATFRNLYVEVVANSADGAHFVEVGSWLGRSAVFMAVEIINSGKSIRFDCVDPWSDGGPDLKHKVARMKRPLYERFLENIAPVQHVITPIRLPSTDAAKLYEDATLDFVMIDGSHQYEDVVSDIKAWRPKMKPGGLLAGDDWNWPGVKGAVQECFSNGEYEVHDTGHFVKKGHPARYWTARL
jgi:predicted O-methyltransferase YrrM